MKPGNVLIAEDGSAKITDFGISHAFDDITLTSTGMVTGTPAYLAPEVARGAASDFASDICSLGATLYLAVEGRPPFGTDQTNPIAVLHRVASGAWEPPSLSGPLTPMLTRMMSPDATGRPSMVEVANALSALHAATYDSASSSATQVVTPRPTLPAATPVAAGNTRVFSAPPLLSGHPAPPKEGRERQRSWRPIVASLITAALGAVLAIVLLGGTGNGNTRASGPTSPVPSKTKSTTQASSSSSSSQKGAPTAQDLANAVTDYFNLIPGDLDAGWARLTPHFQSTMAKNRQRYDDYWNSVERVDVSNASGQRPHTAAATLTYHYSDGHVVTEQTQFRFVRQDGVLKIDAES